MRLMAYNFTAMWCKGKANTAPDALSRYPVLEPSQEDTLAEHEEDYSIAEIRMEQNDKRAENVRLQDLLRQANQDEEYQHLKTIILKGFPDHRAELPDSCKRYWQVRHNLTISHCVWMLFTHTVMYA